MKSCGSKLGRAEMSPGVVRCPYPFARDPEKVRVQLSIGILIVKNRYRVCTRSDAGELAGRVPIRYRGFGAAAFSLFLGNPNGEE